MLQQINVSCSTYFISLLMCSHAAINKCFLQHLFYFIVNVRTCCNKEMFLAAVLVSSAHIYAGAKICMMRQNCCIQSCRTTWEWLNM